VIARGASVLVAVAIAVSCGGTGRNSLPNVANSTANATTAANASPTATPLIDVYGMMGAFPPATFFVVGQDGVKAIALLNHVVKYTIPVAGGDVQVATANEVGRVYVLDQPADGARLRWFDVAAGSERATRSVAGATVVKTGAGHGGLAVDRTTGSVFALLRQNDLIHVEEFDSLTLRPVRRLLGDFVCGERIVAAAGRVVVACLNDGGLVVSERSGRGGKFLVKGGVVALAMLPDGTLMAGAADGRLVRLSPDATELEEVNTLREYGARLIRDGIAVNAGCCFVYGIVDRVPKVDVRVIAGGPTLVAFPEATPPSGGLFVQAPFAYYVIGGQARHIDINQGFVEVMADVGAGAVPGAVADR